MCSPGTYVALLQGRRNRGWGAWGRKLPQILADQLTLSQPAEVDSAH